MRMCDERQIGCTLRQHQPQCTHYSELVKLKRVLAFGGNRGQVTPWLPCWIRVALDHQYQSIAAAVVS